MEKVPEIPEFKIGDKVTSTLVEGVFTVEDSWLSYNNNNITIGNETHIYIVNKDTLTPYDNKKQKE